MCGQRAPGNECQFISFWKVFPWIRYKPRDHSIYAPSQWEMVLHCNAVLQWLCAYAELSLQRANLWFEQFDSSGDMVCMTRHGTRLNLTFLSTLKIRRYGSPEDISQCYKLCPCSIYNWLPCTKLTHLGTSFGQITLYEHPPHLLPHNVLIKVFSVDHCCPKAFKKALI